MKYIILYLLLIAGLPSILVAQYTGGSGDGDNNSTLLGSTLYGTDLLYVYYGGIGDGTASAAGGDIPLPVELSSFTFSITNNRDVILNWVTASEFNNAGFEIERASAIKIGGPSGSDSWVKIGFREGKGSVSTQTNYAFEDMKLQTGKYKYRLKQIDVNGNFEYSALNSEVGIAVPAKFNLSQNYPNPFNPTTKIDFDLPLDSKVNIILFDMTGREVKILVNETRTAGYHSVLFNATGLSSGVYFYRIMTKSVGKDFVATKKMAMIK